MKRVPLLEHDLEAPSAFRPEELLQAVRAERGLPCRPVPEVCLLEFDGDLTDWLVANEFAKRYEAWACFHTTMYAVEVEGRACGIVPRTIGGAYAVLVAEQLAASGAKVVLGLTSAGRVNPELPIPSVVVATEAIRDEGTSYHYLPPGEAVCGSPEVAGALVEELGTLGLPCFSGLVWTTDAPYRETLEAIARHRAAGALAVEMQAASLFAFGLARGVRVGVAAHVTNGVDHAAEQFDKGGHRLGYEMVRAMCRAGMKPGAR